jgi:DNA primase
MSDSVQQIKDRLNIIDVISPYVELHKAGKNFKGKSPFSAEKTPSFYVSPDRGMYYCFSTSQGGDMFTFIQAMEGVEFKEALKQLAEKAGVELVPEDPKKKGERERILSLLKDTTEFFVQKLSTHPEAEAYLGKRKVSADTIRTWQIGYAPGPPTGGWRELKEHLDEKGYTNEEMLKAGVIKTTEGGKEPFDVFRDRVMFPMNNTGGHTVAFSGRLLGQNDKAPKYVNSPETELYKKSELLYGYDKAKHGIRQLDFSLIVEGQFDVVMSHQAGYTNAVAVSGTALTLRHVQLLERLSDRVVLALDADRAGIAAMKRAADLMLKRGLDVKVAEVPEGKDPADLVAESKDKLKAVVGKSVHVIEFLLHVLKRTESDARTLKLKAREEVLPFILLLPNRIDQDHFVDVVAKEIGATTDAIRFELERLRELAPAPSIDSVEPVTTDSTTSAGDMIDKTYTYLVAAQNLVAEEYRTVAGRAIDEVASLTTLKTPDTTTIAEATFLLEQQFDKIAPLAVLDDIVSHINQLRDLIAKRAIGELRVAMEAVDPEEQLVLLKKISEWETVRKAEPVRTNDLLDKKD